MTVLVGLLHKDDFEALPDDLADRLCARFKVTPV
jgi:hypothetical protein